MEKMFLFYFFYFQLKPILYTPGIFFRQDYFEMGTLFEETYYFKLQVPMKKKTRHIGGNLRIFFTRPLDTE
jgi:hypothetical protein